jgi:uncharacterized protein YggU (UPF0235/DUF167 family)
MSFVRAVEGGIELLVWVVPRQSRPGLGPLHGERLRVAVSAPPVEGAANDAVRELVAAALGVARGQIAVTHGQTGRNKTLRVGGEPRALLALAQALVNSGPAAAPSPAPEPRKKSRK